MKCEIKGSVNMKFKGVHIVNLMEVLYIPQAVKKLLRVSRLMSKGTTMGDTQYKMTIKENVVSMVLGAIKGQNKSMMFYLKSKEYDPEGQKALTNLPEEETDDND